MEADRRSSLRRKPLSDCTNTVVASRRNHPSSPAKSAASLVKPPKSSNPSSAAVVTTTTTAAAATNKSNPAASTNSSSLKLETSTGSNISPNVPAPPTPLTHSDVRDHRKPRLPATQSQRQDVKTRKDKGKMVLETPIVQASNLFSPWTQELLSSASGNCNLPTHPAVHSKKPDAQTRKDKGKMVLEASNIKRSDIMAPHATLLMTSSVSGIHDEERPDLLTVKKRRRKHADGITILASSCPPGKKRKGVEPDNDGVAKQSGSHTDPLPLHKKRSWNKQGNPTHALPKEEIERLKSYYADIDAFDLPEEIASESDLD